MRALLSLAFLALFLSPTLKAQDSFWGPACTLQAPEGYKVVESGQGWGYTIDLVPKAEGAQTSLSLLRVGFVLQAESADSLVQQLWGVEGPQLAQAGWELAGQSETIQRTIITASFEEFEDGEEPPADKQCTGQRLTLKSTVNPDRRAEVEYFAWVEANGSFGFARSFAEGEAQQASVVTAFSELSTWGITENSHRNVHVHGIGFSIPAFAQHEVNDGGNGGLLLRVGFAEGVFDILVGAKDPDNADLQAQNSINGLLPRFDQFVLQGLGELSGRRMGWVNYRNELRKHLVFDWSPTGGESIQIHAVSMVLNDHAVIFQAQSVPGQGAALGDRLLRLIRGGLAVPGRSDHERWNAVQFREYATSVPVEVTATWLPLLGEPGLLLGKGGLDFGLWMSCFDYEKEAELPQALRGWMQAYLEQQGLIVDPSRIQASMHDIYPEEDAFSIVGDPIPSTVPRIEYRDESGDQPRIYFASLLPFRDSCAVAIVDAHPADQVAAERLAVGALERAMFESSGAQGALQYIHRASFPLRYPGKEFTAWSAEGAGGSSSRLFHAEGELELLDYELNEVSAKGFNAHAATKSALEYERSRCMREGESATPISMSKRMLGGQLRDWHGFSSSRDGVSQTHAVSVWRSEGRRFRLMAHYRDDLASPPAFLASLNRCQIDDTVGRAGVASLPTFPVPFGGMWGDIPEAIGLSDALGIATGFGVILHAPVEQDWSVYVRAFLVKEPGSEEQAFDMLWATGPHEDWQDGVVPEVSLDQVEWLGQTVTVQRRTGQLRTGHSFSVAHAVHFSDRVCRSWTVRGSDFALESLTEVLDSMRNSFEIVSDIATAPPREGQRNRYSIGDLQWEVSADFKATSSEATANEANSHAFESQTGLCELLQIEMPDEQAWTLGLMEAAGMLVNGKVVSRADARKLITPKLVNIHGQLRPAIRFSHDNVEVAMAIASAGEKSHAVMAFLSLDPMQDLVQALHGWPAPSTSRD